MTAQRTIDTDAIQALEKTNCERVRQLSMHERGEHIIAACRAAATIEASRLQMGMAAARPAPWPESTWKFLAEAARRVRAE